MRDEHLFLAKSSKETIVEHTKNLWRNQELLQNLYPEIPVNWSLLDLACTYHDLGKMNHLFQEKIREGVWTKKGEIPHALLSIPLLPLKKLKSSYEIEELKALTYAIAFHHERDFEKVDMENYKKEIGQLNKSAALFPFEQLNIERPAETIKKLSKTYISLRSRFSSDDEEYKTYVMLKGLLNRLDYAASGYYEVEYPANFLERNLPKALSNIQEKENKPVSWNAMQEYAREHQEDSLIIIGQTGLGKTEAGLLWLGDSKGFFTLPLKAAINAIYNRVKDQLTDEGNHQKQIGLLHSDSLAVLMSDDKELSAEDLSKIESYLNETRSWSLPLTITTLDQTFDFVYHYKGFESKLATFAYSKVIIDEIQMYSPDLLAYLIKGLKEIQDFGGKFLIMTATMPPYLLDLFTMNGLCFKRNDQPFLHEERQLRHNMQIVAKELTANEVADLYKGNKLLVVCNTIKQAKAIYNDLIKKGLQVPIQLLHSQFIRRDRQQKEEDIFDFAGSSKNGIWIATQIVEASLDIDFDCLITELSELNGLFQRMGRCYRKRSLVDKNEPNVYVFDGGEGVTSGISSGEHAVVHRNIFQLAKTELRKKGSGLISESEKMALIEKTYTTENMAETEYYQKINNMLDWLRAKEEDALKKEEVKKMFHDIHTRNVIPENIYHENQTDIQKQLAILQPNPETSTEQKNRKPTIYEKQQAKSNLENYMVSIQEYMYQDCSKRQQVQVEQIDKFQQLSIVKGEYSFEKGFSVLQDEFDPFMT